MKAIFWISSLFVIATLFTLVPAYIIKDIADLFNVPLLRGLTFAQTYGLCTVFWLVSTKASDIKANEEGEWTQSLIKAVALPVGYILGWGMAYVMYWIIS